MDGLSYKKGDIRAMLPHPDVVHHGKNFREGWNKGAKRPVEDYDDPNTLDQLTWENLGYRLDRAVGSASEPFIDGMYSMCCLLQHEQKNAKAMARSE